MSTMEMSTPSRTYRWNLNDLKPTDIRQFVAETERIFTRHVLNEPVAPLPVEPLYNVHIDRHVYEEEEEYLRYEQAMDEMGLGDEDMDPAVMFAGVDGDGGDV